MIKCLHKICQYPDCGRECGMTDDELIKYLVKEYGDLHFDYVALRECCRGAIDVAYRGIHALTDRGAPYKPTCKCGYPDCVGDPAYIKQMHPEWWVELGMPTCCADLCYGKDPCYQEDGEWYCDHYDDEDK